MPTPPRTKDYERKAMLAAWDEFESPIDWRRSKKGNLCRCWGEDALTIFKRKDGYFGWCIANDIEKQFSRDRYETEEGAMMALGEAVGMWP